MGQEQVVAGLEAVALCHRQQEEAWQRERARLNEVHKRERALMWTRWRVRWDVIVTKLRAGWSWFSVRFFERGWEIVEEETNDSNQR